jgi:nitrogen regulatory protein P-II 1
MKLISSCVRFARLDAVKQALCKANVVAVTVVEAHDFAPQDHGTTVWMGHVRTMDSSPKLEIRVVVHDCDVDGVVEAVMRAARTGAAGDGHICVMPIDHRYNICSGLREV